MNLFEYVPLMKEMNTPFSIAGVAILGLFLVFIFFKMLGGMRRGGWRQLIRTLATLAAAVVSYIVATIISNNIIGSLNEDKLAELITLANRYVEGAGDLIRNLLNNINSEAIEHILVLPATLIVVPVIATLIFFLINLIFKIIRAIIIKIFNFKKAKSSPSRLYGALLSFVEAMIWIIMITLPISAVATMVDDVYNEAIEASVGEERDELVSTYETYLLPFTKNPAVSMVEKLGGRAICDGIATIKIGDENTNMRKEIVDVSHIMLSDVSALRGADFSELSEDQKIAITSILDTLSDSPYMSNVLIGILQCVPTAIDNDIIPIKMDGEYEALFNEIIAYFGGITRDTIGQDLGTVRDLYFAISDSGVLTAAKEGGNIMELLQEKRKEGDDTISKIVAILKSNKRSAPMVTALTEALISTLSNVEIGNGDVTVTYDSLKDGMNDVLSVDRENYADEEEYMDALSGTLDSTLREHGIELEEEIVDSIAEYVDTNYSEVGELTDEEFNDVLLHYYDAYLNYLESGTIPDNFGGTGE